MKRRIERWTLGLSLLAHGVAAALIFQLVENAAPPREAPAHRLALAQFVPAPQPSPAPAAEPEPTPEPVAEAVPEPLSEPAPLPEPTPQPEPPPPPKPEPKPAPKPKPVPQPKPSPKVEPQPVTQAQASPPPAPAAPVSTAQALPAPVAAAPTPVADAPMAPAPNQADAEAAYAQAVRAAVERCKSYPRLARRLHLEGSATLRFHLDASGRLVARRLHASAGHAALDEAALAALDCARFPAPPEGQPREREFTLPLSFTLTE